MHTEASKKDAEIKLSSIGHTLRRIAGVQLDGTVSMPYRLLSPSRRYSPARGCHGDFHESRSLSADNLIVDVDPELVRKGVRTLMHQVAQIERERVSLFYRIHFMRKLNKHKLNKQTGRYEDPVVHSKEANSRSERNKLSQ